MVPWGTPAITRLHVDLYGPILIRCCLSLKKLEHQFDNTWETPRIESLRMRML